MIVKAKVIWLNPPIKSQPLSDQSIVIKWYLQETALKQIEKCEKWGEFYQENVKVQYYSINIKNEINIIKISGNFSLH